VRLLDTADPSSVVDDSHGGGAVAPCATTGPVEVRMDEDAATLPSADTAVTPDPAKPR
jgi:hypothetical protein